MKDNILGFDVLNYDYDEFVNNIVKEIERKEKHFIVNINPFIIMNFYKNEQYIELFNQEKYQIPDGNGIVWASKRNKKLIKSRVTGIDLMDMLCERSVTEKISIFLCGSAPKVAEHAKTKLEEKYPGIKITGVCDGFISPEEMIKQINKSKAQMIFVALGSPRQEDFILKYKKELRYAKILMPVGGSLDVISGNIKRAPKAFIKMQIEWLYRTVTQPKRIFRNLSLIKFMFLVLFNKKR